MIPTPLRRLLSFAAVAAALSAVALPVLAETRHLGTHESWEAYTEDEAGRQVCYMGSEPTKERGKYAKRGDTYVLITHRPVEKSFDVISVKAGYTYQPGSEVDLLIGGQSYKLFTDAGHAFAYDAKTDDAIVKAMIRGTVMTIKGTSNRGTLTTDTYSLTGFTAAHKAIDAACKGK